MRDLFIFNKTNNYTDETKDVIINLDRVVAAVRQTYRNGEEKVYIYMDGYPAPFVIEGWRWNEFKARLLED